MIFLFESQKTRNNAREHYSLIADKILMRPKFYETALSLAPEEKPGFSVLDVGSGQGLLLRKIRANYPRSRIFGVEFSKELVTRSNRVQDANCIMADALHIPLPEKSIDVAFCTEVIEHVNDPVKLLNEIRVLLKPKGKLVITVPNRLGYYPAYAFLRKVPANTRRRYFQRFVYWLIPDDDPALSFQPVDHAYSSNEVLGWMRKTGYEIMNYAGYDFFKNLRAARVQELLGRFVSPILAYSFFIVASPVP
jgi:ubiquinone/menaquinone biosynthesis C-methylase UbiE